MAKNRKKYQTAYRKKNPDKLALYRYRAAKRVVVLYEAAHPEAEAEFFAIAAADAEGVPRDGRPRKTVDRLAPPPAE